MDQQALFTRILNLSAPWYVEDVELDGTTDIVRIKVSYDQSERVYCPICQSVCSSYDKRKRQWRHLDTCQYPTLIEANVPRVFCRTHGIHTIQVPWAEGRSHYTKRYEERVSADACQLTVNALARRFRLSWSCVDRILKRSIQRGLSRRWEVDCRHLYIDETSVAKGRHYLTVMSNQKGQVIALADGRSGDSLKQCLRSVPIQSLSKVKTISMDMSPAYLKAVRDHFGSRAQRLIAIDHFHVARLLTSALNDIRKAEMKELPNLQRMHLHKTRYYWLRNGEHLNTDVEQELESQKCMLQKTAIAWMLKEKARAIWKGIESPARSSWRHWFKIVNISDLKPLKTAADTIRNHLPGILNAMKYGESNARSEAMNKNIQNLRRAAHGYRNIERLKAMILLRYGKLDWSYSHQER